MAAGASATIDDWQNVDDWKPVTTLPPRPEVPPFPVDDWVKHQLKDLPPEQQADKRSKFASVMYEMARPWMDVGYSASAGLNRGMANFAFELDAAARFMEHAGLGKSGGILESMGKESEANAQVMENLLPTEGIHAIDKVNRFVGKSVGEAIPGTAQFLLDWASGLTLPYMSGVTEARDHDTDPTIGGIAKAAQVGMLGTMFKMTAPLKAWMRASVLGTYFGTEEAIAAKPGERAQGFLKGAATGGLLGITTPNGEYGIRDLYPEIERAALSSVKTSTPASPDTLRPAVKTAEGKVEQGVSGETHPDVIERTGVEEAKPDTVGTEAGAKNDTSLFQQAKEELGPDASMSDVARRAQELKTAQASVKGPSDNRGFVNREGKFMDREQSKQWVKENEPEVYSAWLQLKNGDESAELHAQDYNAAKELAKEPDPNIRELISALRNITPDTDLGRRVSLAEDLTQRAGIAKEGIHNGLTRIKAAGAAIRDFYMRPPKADGVRGMIDLYKGSKEISDIENARFAKQIKQTFSDRTQRALTVYAQANGDSATLTDWAEKTTDPVLKEKYQDALNLTDQQKQFASNYRAHMDAMLYRAIDAGLLEDGVENYVNQIWEKSKVSENSAARQLLGESNSGLLRANPAFAKKRIYDSYFEGEQAGHTPKDARLGYLITAYHQAFDEALNARAFVRSLTEATASDGRPMAVTSGMGIPLPKGETVAESWIIKPRAVSAKTTEIDPITGEKVKTPIDLSDYRNGGIDHPALRKWKWAANDNDGNPIYVEGDLKFHPEAYKDVKNFLGKSAIREYALGRAALKVSTELKGTMLGFFSTFHQVHLGKTAASYVVNPFNLRSIDLNDPLTTDLIKHGHVLYDGNAMSEWSEGVRGPGLIRFIPKVGPMAERYTEYMFGLDGYVPRLKNTLAHTIYERNAARYPELSRDELLTLTASQSNAAMGGQNWRGMMANKTAQDILRLTTLAPDFLVSRARLTGQMLKPYGREQFNAIAIRGALGLYVTAKVIEGTLAQLEPDKAEVHWDRPFSVTYNGKEYTIRSQQGDIQHFIQDPRSFAYYRLNPAITKPAIEMMTGRDQFGRKRDVTEQMKDWATSAVPIAGQGFFKKEDYPLYESILASIGVSTWNYRSDAEKIARDIASEKNKAEMEGVSKERIATRSRLQGEYEKTGDFEPIRKAFTDGKIAFKDIQWITNRNLEGDLQGMVKQFSLPDSLKVWDKATEEEKNQIQPTLVAKWIRFESTATPNELAAYEEKMQDVIRWTPTRELKTKRRYSIR